MAFAYPDAEVAGVDTSRIMVDYANARARSQGIHNASFGVMDVTQPLDFGDSSFDLLNARFLTAALPRVSWQPLIAECMRLLRPGGIVRLTEMVDAGITNSAAFERMQTLMFQMLHRAGYGFSPSGISYGMAPVLPHLLRQAGFQNVQYVPHALEFSSDSTNWGNYYRNTEVAYKVGQPFFVKMGLASQEEIEHLYQQMLIEMNMEDFCGVWSFFTTWAIKA